MSIKIGITERGDAGIDFSWEEKLDTVDGAIIISKYLSDELISKLIKHQEKIIFHCTCTGYGGTVLEPNVPPTAWTLKQLSSLIQQGFDPIHIVLRIDPIIPTEKGIQVFENVALQAPANTRSRISILDMYPHVRERFKAAGLPLPYGNNNFQASTEQMASINELIENLTFHGLQFEACAEKELKSSSGNLQYVGCVSPKDLTILGLTSLEQMSAGKQRNGCLCLSCKTELLTQKHPCKNNCIYCYWKN